jgi:hypothetical protein
VQFQRRYFRQIRRSCLKWVSSVYFWVNTFFSRNKRYSVTNHGPLKLRTVHLSDNTIIYESKVSTQNLRSIAHSRKKIETPKVYFIHGSKLAIPRTPIVHPRFLCFQSSFILQIFLKVGLLYDTFGGPTNFYYIPTCLCA